jgi:hypothetical protein
VQTGTSGGAPSANVLQFSSLPSITPNPAVAGQPVQFAAAASDTNGEAIAYTWDFGDGTSGTGATVSHTYSAPGLYVASVSVSDATLTATTGISVGVNADTSASGVQPVPFKVQKAMLKFNLKDSQKDSLILSGVLPVNNFLPKDKTVRTVVGSLNREFQLNAHGSAGDAASSLKLSGKIKNGVFTTSSVKFMLVLKKQTLSENFQKFIFPGTVSNSILNIPVVISTTGNDWQVDFVKFAYNPDTGSTVMISGR